MDADRGWKFIVAMAGFAIASGSSAWAQVVPDRASPQSPQGTPAGSRWWDTAPELRGPGVSPGGAPGDGTGAGTEIGGEPGAAIGTAPGMAPGAAIGTAPSVVAASVVPPAAGVSGGGTGPVPALSSGLGGGVGEGGTFFGMLGDQGPGVYLKQFPAIQNPAIPRPFPPRTPPNAPSPRLASALVPSVRGFKIAENQSPQPQDRVFYSFNYFADLNGQVNRALDSPVGNLRVYRHIFGFEKTFDEGRGSIGLRVPINTLTADSTISGNFRKLGGTSTATGDLTIFTKYILKQNVETGSLLSAGLSVTPTTGPDAFAGANYLTNVHTTTIQPFIGYVINRGNFYIHGFAALDTPASTRDVTTVYNDAGLGYFLYRSNNPRQFLTAVAPTFEVHVNNPLTHRDAFNPNDPAATPDVVNLTYGINFEAYQSSVLTLGFVTPVTGPRPFDYEALVLLNIRFGRSRARAVSLPFLGG